MLISENWYRGAWSVEPNSSPDGESGNTVKPAPAAIGVQPDYAGPAHEHHEIKDHVVQPTRELRMTEAMIKGGHRGPKRR
jgi:hypothetical protein